MTELSLFSGAGGGLLGSKLLGWRTVGYVEWDAYCQRVLRVRIRDGILDDAPIFSDIRAFDGRPYRGRVDIVTGGFPCQPFSVAGKRKGEADERNMWLDTVRILREVRPRWALLENVPGLVTSGYFGTVMGDLAEIGFDAEWMCLSAAACGAPHLRERLWILAYPDGQRELQQKGFVIQERRRPCNGGEEMADSECVGLEGAEFQRQRIGFGERVSDDCWWEFEPDVGRVADGVASRMDRLRAIGNGQVPAVVRDVWGLLLRRVMTEIYP